MLKNKKAAAADLKIGVGLKIKDQDKMRQTAVMSALAAGGELFKRYGKYNRREQKFKSAHEIVTPADLAAEKIILAKIRKDFPTHEILSEEAGRLKKTARTDTDFLWIIDPLDGTHNFSFHNPFWAVSIALAYKGEIILGVIFAPILNELYVAESGEGAWLNGRRLKVSDIKDGRALQAVCSGSHPTDIKFMTKYYGYQKLHSLDARQLGSAALELAYTAGGRLESIVIAGARSWDVAAGILLVREAGGTVTDFKNQPWNLKSKDMAADNGCIHAEIIKVIKKI